MPINYYEEGEGPSVPAQEGILDDPDEDTFRVLVSTDNHLGYEENDSVRGMDSFAAFEEVLYLAKRFRCDMVLLAGDLFHENRPSRRTLFKTMEIIRRYCLGPNPVKIQITSDPAQNFRTGQVNYQDANFAIDLPIFSIHGNHDDPTRDGGDLLAALDLLSISNMVNYFGCQEQVDDVRLYPVMLKKGMTQIGLYGLGSMRDERLNRMWREGKVKFFRYQKQHDDDEEADDNNHDDVFNMFVLHQNRDVGRGTKNCVQETLIPDFCDLVVWGHEHECQIEFAESLVGTFRITQPGSSVATSLVAGEAVRKKVGVLDIKGKNFRMHTVPLTQVRSFVMSDINLREHRANLDPDDSKIDKKITKVLEEQVNAIIMDAKDERLRILQEAREAGSNAAEDDSPLVGRLLNPEKVLVRLRVEHTSFQTLNNQRFGAKFVDEIANSDNILLFRKEKKSTKTVESKAMRKAREAIRRPIDPEELERTNVEDLVASILELPGSRLELLSEKGLGEALEEYVDKNNLQSIPNVSEDQLRKRQKVLISNKDFVGKAENVKEVFIKNDETKVEEKEAEPLGKKKKNTTKSKIKRENADSWKEEEEENLANSHTSGSSRNSTAKSSQQRSTAGRGKHKIGDSDDDDIVIVDDDDDDTTPKKVLTKSRLRRSAKKVNYGDDDGDDGYDSDAPVDVPDAAADDDDVMEIEYPRKLKGRKTAVASSHGRKTAAATKPTPRREAAAASSARKTTRKKKFQLDSDDDDDDDVDGAGASIGLDDNWGSAATRSQF